MTKGPGDEVERSGSASLEIGLCFAGSCNIRSFIYKELWSCGGGWQVYLVLVLPSKMLWIYSFPYAHPYTRGSTRQNSNNVYLLNSDSAQRQFNLVSPQNAEKTHWNMPKAVECSVS